MGLLALVSFHRWERSAPWAFCHKVPSSNEDGREIFLHSWVPRVHAGEKVVSLFIQYFSDTTVSSLANKFLLKLAANRTAYGRISLPLYRQEDLPWSCLQVMRDLTMQSTFALLCEYSNF